MTTNRPYILWRRVSTKQQSETSLGLDAQQAIAEYFMHSEPEKVFTDVYSGTKLAECPNLQKAIKYCKEHNYLLVIAKTDRFRNVQQALAILDEMGEGNLCFCDLPTTDRTVLTLMFAIWERQALMGRINTKRALAERNKQAERNGYWISKTNNVRTKLGRPADYVDENGKEHYDVSAMVEAASQMRTNRAIAWKEQSKAVKAAIRKRAEGYTLQAIADEIGHLYDENKPDDPNVPNPYATPNGCKPSKGTISKWLRESNPTAI